ncbi:MAG: TolC family protein [Saprospiraceae bacterium]|nr:TolC family protein [Saprospiraceae bacterium]
MGKSGKGPKTGDYTQTVFPPVSLSAQSTYQSEVTTFPVELPGVQIEALSKDQYRILGEVNQKLYDGGATQQQKLLATTAYEIEQNGVEVELEKIREQIIQLYFNILELDARMRIVALSREDLLASLKIIEAAVTNGIALKSEKNALEAALINLEQQTMNCGHLGQP